MNQNDNADVKWFAFAVYKYDAEGDLVTKGKEVERRYQISYALFIICFVALISVLIEVSMGQYRRTTAKSMEIISGKSIHES